MAVERVAEEEERVENVVVEEGKGEVENAAALAKVVDAAKGEAVADEAVAGLGDDAVASVAAVREGEEGKEAGKVGEVAVRIVEGDVVAKKEGLGDAVLKGEALVGVAQSAGVDLTALLKPFL